MGYLGSNVVLIPLGNHICRFGYFQMQSNVANKCSNSQLKRTTCQVNCANFHLSSLWLSWIELRSLTLAIGQPHFLPTYSTVVLPLPLPADLDKGGNLCCSIAPVPNLALHSSSIPSGQWHPSRARTRVNPTTAPAATDPNHHHQEEHLKQTTWCKQNRLKDVTRTAGQTTSASGLGMPLYYINKVDSRQAIQSWTSSQWGRSCERGDTSPLPLQLLVTKWGIAGHRLLRVTNPWAL